LPLVEAATVSIVTFEYPGSKEILVEVRVVVRPDDELAERATDPVNVSRLFRAIAVEPLVPATKIKLDGLEKIEKSTTFSAIVEE
jgi:hypothetical protein